jgi:hypothetical protein
LAIGSLRILAPIWLVVSWSQCALAGEIAGVPSELPPYLDRPAEINFSNDFLGRGGAVDDFRTQQVILSAPVGDKWLVTLDHSTMTLSETSSPGRLDQMSVSLGYRLLETSTADTITRLAVGGGLRSMGDFGGQRLQNGFHRLIDSNVEFLPYTGDTGTDATAWVDVNHYRLLRGSVAGSDDWRLGYWLRGTSLASTGGQWDSAAGIYGTLSHDVFDAWVGLRRDWRSGYEVNVLRQTAAAEDDLAVVVGVRWGPVVLETVQQLHNDASYGQIRLIAMERGAYRLSDEPVRLAVETGFLLPDIAYHLGFRLSNPRIAGAGNHWRRSVILLTSYGQPQYEDDASLYLDTTQLGAGVEWERSLSGNGPWTSVYGSVGGGVRRERLVGDGPRAGQESGSVSRGVVMLGLGLRVHAATMGKRWRYRLQLGLNASLPVDDASLGLGSETFRVQQPHVEILLGMSFDRR